MAVIFTPFILVSTSLHVGWQEKFFGCSVSAGNESKTNGENNILKRIRGVEFLK